MTDKTMNPDYQRDISDFVSRNVICCVSNLVKTLATGTEYLVRTWPGKKPLADLVYRASDLTVPKAREYHTVTEWFADRLEERGERVDRDFAGLIVWARTTTGQAISLDGVVTEIYDAWQKELARMISGVGPAETVVA